MLQWSIEMRPKSPHFKIRRATSNTRIAPHADFWFVTAVVDYGHFAPCVGGGYWDCGTDL